MPGSLVLRFFSLRYTMPGCIWFTHAWFHTFPVGCPLLPRYSYATFWFPCLVYAFTTVPIPVPGCRLPRTGSVLLALVLLVLVCPLVLGHIIPHTRHTPPWVTCTWIHLRFPPCHGCTYTPAPYGLYLGSRVLCYSCTRRPLVLGLPCLGSGSRYPATWFIAFGSFGFLVGSHVLYITGSRLCYLCLPFGSHHTHLWFVVVARCTHTLPLRTTRVPTTCGCLLPLPRHTALFTYIRGLPHAGWFRYAPPHTLVAFAPLYRAGCRAAWVLHYCTRFALWVVTRTPALRGCCAAFILRRIRLVRCRTHTRRVYVCTLASATFGYFVRAFTLRSHTFAGLLQFAFHTFGSARLYMRFRTRWFALVYCSAVLPRTWFYLAVMVITTTVTHRFTRLDRLLPRFTFDFTRLDCARRCAYAPSLRPVLTDYNAGSAGLRYCIRFATARFLPFYLHLPLPVCYLPLVTRPVYSFWHAFALRAFYRFAAVAHAHTPFTYITHIAATFGSL